MNLLSQQSGLVFRQSGLAICLNAFGQEAWRANVGDPLRNGITDTGINNALDGNVLGQNMYVGLIGATGYDSDVGLSSSDTMASHAGWVEYQSYDEATRLQWNYGAAAGKSISNSTPAEFTFNEETVLKGFFIALSSTKGESASILWATALFSSGDRSVVDNQVIQFTYTLRSAQGS